MDSSAPPQVFVLETKQKFSLKILDDEKVSSIQNRQKEVKNQTFYLAIPLNSKDILTDKLNEFKNSFVFTAWNSKKPIVSKASNEYFNKYANSNDNTEKESENLTIHVKIIPHKHEFPVTIPGNTTFSELTEIVQKSYIKYALNTIEWFHNGKNVSSNDDRVFGYIKGGETFIGRTREVAPFLLNENQSQILYQFNIKFGSDSKPKIIVIPLKPTLRMDQVQNEILKEFPQWGNANFSFFHQKDGKSVFAQSSSYIGKYDNTYPFSVLIKEKLKQNHNEKNPVKVQFKIITIGLNETISKEINVTDDMTFLDISNNILAELPIDKKYSLNYSYMGKPIESQTQILSLKLGKGPIIVTAKEHETNTENILHFSDGNEQYHLVGINYATTTWGEVKIMLTQNYPDFPVAFNLIHEGVVLDVNKTVAESNIGNTEDISIVTLASQKSIEQIQKIIPNISNEQTIELLSLCKDNAQSAIGLYFQQSMPNPADVNEFMQITQSSKEVAIQYLSQYSVLDTAINKYIDQLPK